MMWELTCFASMHTKPAPRRSRWASERRKPFSMTSCPREDRLEGPRDRSITRRMVSLMSWRKNICLTPAMIFPMLYQRARERNGTDSRIEISTFHISQRDWCRPESTIEQITPTPPAPIPAHPRAIRSRGMLGATAQNNIPRENMSPETRTMVDRPQRSEMAA